MDFGHYTDDSVALALELVNSYEPGLSDVDDLADVDALRALAKRYDLAVDVIDAAELEYVRSLRDRLRDVLLSPDDAPAANQLNALLEETGARPRLTNHDTDHWHLHVDPPAHGLGRQIGAIAAMAVAAVWAEHGRDRFGVCASDTCVELFVDSSRNRSRRFCGEGCANRTNVRAHRARARGDQESSPA